MKYIAIGRQVFKVSEKQYASFLEKMRSEITDLDCNVACMAFMKGRKPFIVLDLHVDN
jgi:hypothetical protein